MELTYASYILVLGATIVLVLLLRPALERLGVPPLVGYFLLGFALRLADARWTLLSEPGHQIFEFLAYVGVVVLLFRIGLESDLPGLIQHLPSASVIWAGNVAVFGGLGDWAVTPALFANMVLVSAATTLLAPPLVRPLLQQRRASVEIP